MALAYLSIAWVAGTLLGSFYALSPLIMLTGLIPLILIPFFTKYKSCLLTAGFCLVAFVGSGVRFQANLPLFDEHHIQYYNDRAPVQLEAVITSDPELRDKSIRFQVSLRSITTEGRTMNINGNALVRASRYPELNYGDLLQISGRLETPPKYDSFDYKEYLYHHNIYSIINFPRVEVIGKDKDSILLNVLYAFREQLSFSLARVLPEPQCSLAQGMLLGIRSNIPDSLREAFSRTGTSHVLAISGLNLTILLGIFLNFGLALFGRRYHLHIWLALLMIWAYALLTGMSPPVIRSAIMGSVFLIAELLGRQRNAFTALVFAAAIMVGIEPQALWDISFQLSFISMLGLLFIFSHISKWGRKKIASAIGTEGAKVSICNGFIDCGAVTLAAILATLPIIAHTFGIISLVSLPANIFVLPSVPGIIGLSALVSVSNLFIPAIAFILALVDWLFISYFIIVIQILSSLPLAAVNLDNMQVWQIYLYYSLLAILMISIRYRTKLKQLFIHLGGQIRILTSHTLGFITHVPKRWLILPLIVIAALVWIAVMTMPDSRLHVSIFDVGQGEAILIQTPDHQKILVDGGPSPQALKLALGKKLPFWDRTIDLIVVTQPQADHITGLIEICRNYNVKNIYDSGLRSDSNINTQLLNTVQNLKINHATVHRGERINIGDSLYMDVLNPQCQTEGYKVIDINNNSMVLRLCFIRISFLLTGDIGSETELDLMATQANLKSTVLKVAHHGSKDSSSLQLIEAVSPDAAVISAGKGNNFGHPHPEVIKRLADQIDRSNIFVTAENGTIEFITDGYKLWVKTDQVK